MWKLLSSMYAASVAGARARLGSTAALYGAHALFGLTYTVFAAMYLASVYATHPLFDRGVGGDVMALATALIEGRGVISALVWSGVALALAYFVVSEYLTGGLLERLRDGESVSPAEARRRFGAGAAAHLGRFLRVWLWSWLLWVPALIALGVGVAVGSRGMSEAIDTGPVVSKLLSSILPGLLLAGLAAAAGDYARWLAVREPTLAPRRAFFRAVKLVVTRPVSLVHFVSYVAAWLLLSGLYVLLTAGHPYAGAAGAWLLFVLRQLLVFARITLRVGAFAGQEVLLDAKD